jgi:CRISPR-associated protein Cas2
MRVLIIHDVKTSGTGGRRRLRRIAGICQDFGQRVQWSAFECLVSREQWNDLRLRLEGEMDKERDSLRFYHLGSDSRRLSVVGVEKGMDLEGLLLV